MSVSFSHFSVLFSESSIAPSISLFPAAANNFLLLRGSRLVLYGGAGNFCQRFCVLKQRILKRLNPQQRNRKHVPANELKRIRNQDKDQSKNPSRNDEQFSEAAPAILLSSGWKRRSYTLLIQFLEIPPKNTQEQLHNQRKVLCLLKVVS